MNALTVIRTCCAGVALFCLIVLGLGQAFNVWPGDSFSAALMAVGIILGTRAGVLSMTARPPFYLLLAALACSQPQAPEPQTQLRSACLAWPSGGIICCEPSPAAGTCIWYPTSATNNTAGGLALFATCSEWPQKLGQRR